MNRHRSNPPQPSISTGSPPASGPPGFLRGLRPGTLLWLGSAWLGSAFGWGASQASAQTVPAPTDEVQAEAAPAPPSSPPPPPPQDEDPFDPFAMAEGDLAEKVVEADDGTQVVVPEDSLFQVDVIEVSAARREELRTVGGSATLVDEQQLEDFQYDDPNQVLAQVPGVYLRSEDGYGLRPNIGLRGGSSDRSKKVTLLEDGIAFAPAPYTASAAYYFPLMSHVTSVEVLKGPGALESGPHTVGGTINLRTRQVPDEGWIALAEGSGGSFRYGSAHGYAGYGAARWGLLGEFSHLQSRGFKNLDGGGDTGFSKQEGRLKFRLNSRTTARVYQRLDVKLGYAHEDSNETYLGLSDTDFGQTPLRRYAATQGDAMGWWRTQAVARYAIGVGELDASVTLYRHDFDRLWTRFDGIDSENVYDLLRNPGNQADAVIAVLSGEADSFTLGAGRGRIRLANNQRRFVSQGVDTALKVGFRTGLLRHEVRTGARLHFDELVRDHTEDAFLMQSGTLVPDGSERVSTNDSTASTLALAAFVVDELHFRGLTLTPGVRMELIFNEAKNRGKEERLSGQQHALLGGAGLHYAITDTLGVLGGVHQGFSPAPVAVSSGSSAGPEGGSGQADPERALNYEAGGRYLKGSTRLEALGFYNDYDNILTTGDGADITSTNGGAARVYGVEVSANHDFALPWSLQLPVNASYTYQQGEFLSSFDSSDPTIGRDVKSGDELTYLPPHQFSITSGLRFRSNTAAVLLGVKFTDRMRERPGQGAIAVNERTDRYALLDLSAHWYVLRDVKLFVRLDNLTGAQPLVSRRPLAGARPIKPRTFQLGAQWEL